MSSNSITHWTGSRWKYSEMHNDHTDMKAVIVCGGPSLSKVDKNKLKGPGKFVLGVNNTYPYIKPDAWIGMDDARCYARSLVHEPFPKFYRGTYHSLKFQNTILKDVYNSHFISCKKGAKEDFLSYTKDTSDYFLWEKNVLSMSLQLVVAMGFKEIYLVGCDLSMDQGKYFNDVSLNEKESSENKRLYNTLFEWLSWLNKEVKKVGIKIYSSSPESKINKFLCYRSLDALNHSAEKLFLEEGELWHARTLHDIYEEDEKRWSEIC